MKSVYPIILTAVTGIVFFLAAPFVIYHLKTEPLPLYGQVIDFTLIDSQNKAFASDQLKDKVWVADFIFTSCAGPCPLMSQKLASIHRSYVLEEGVRLLSISVDPERDTPQVLTDYAKRYNADTSKWHFATGPIDELHRLAIEGFKIGTPENPLIHSQRFVLVDKKMQMRGQYDSEDPKEIKRLFRDIAILLKEPS